MKALRNLMVGAAALLGAIVGPADAAESGSQGWLVGAWLLCEDPDQSPQDTLQFHANGAGFVLSATRKTAFHYQLAGSSVTLEMKVNQRPLTIALSASPGFDKLLLHSKRTGNTATYVRADSDDARKCSVVPMVKPLFRSMPDGKRWTLTNMAAELPGSFCYGDKPANCARYGRLYTWADAQKLCRSLGADWRLPTMDDWKGLARHYGGLSGDGEDKGRGAFRALLAGGQSGLEMLLGGGRDERGYVRLEEHGFYWSASESSPTDSRFLNFGKGSNAVYDQDPGPKSQAFSVRCVSDSR